MCGIVGYIGEKKATPILLDALEKLEYRGYDSAGIALVSGKGINIFKTRGRIADLRKIIDAAPAGDSCVGIGHTRWATHGEPSDLMLIRTDQRAAELRLFTTVLLKTILNFGSF